MNFREIVCAWSFPQGCKSSGAGFALTEDLRNYSLLKLTLSFCILNLSERKLATLKLSEMKNIAIIICLWTLNLNAQAIDLEKKVLMQFDKNSSKFEDQDAIIASNTVFLGDLNADNINDAVVFYALAPREGGNANMGSGLVVFLNDGKTVKEVSAISPDFMFYVKEIADYKLQIIKLEYTSEDMFGNPTQETPVFYILNNQNKLQESRTY